MHGYNTRQQGPTHKNEAREGVAASTQAVELMEQSPPQQSGTRTEPKPPATAVVDTRESLGADDGDNGMSQQKRQLLPPTTAAVDTREPHSGDDGDNSNSSGDGVTQQKRQQTSDSSSPAPVTPANQNPPKRKSLTPRTGEIMKIETNIAFYEAQIKDYQRADKRATTQLQRVQANLATCEEKIKALKSFDQLLEANQAKLKANEQELKENRDKLEESEARTEENNQDLKENEQDLKENEAKLEKNEAKLEENQKEQLNWLGKLHAAQQAGNSDQAATAQAAIDLLAKAEQRLETEDKRLRRENADIISSEADIRARKEARQRELEAEKQELKAQVTQLTGQFKESQTARAELQAEIGESHLACRQPPPLSFVPTCLHALDRHQSPPSHDGISSFRPCSLCANQKKKDASLQNRRVRPFRLA